MVWFRITNYMIHACIIQTSPTTHVGKVSSDFPKACIFLHYLALGTEEVVGYTAPTDWLTEIWDGVFPSTAEGSDNQGEFSGGNIHLITDSDVWEQKLAEAKRDNKIVIANFSASWCDPCRMIVPYYRELSEQHPSIMFLSIDVDELTEFSSQWDIKATPTFFFLKNGQQFDKLVGANRAELQKKIASAMDSVAPS